MKTKIFLTILMTILMVSSTFAQDNCPETHSAPGTFSDGPSIDSVTYTVLSESVTDETANLNNNLPPEMTLTSNGPATCILTGAPIADRVVLNEGWWDTPDTYYKFRNIYYDGSRGVVLSVFPDGDKCAYGEYEVGFNTRTSHTAKRTDGLDWNVRGFAYDENTGYLYLVGTTVAGGILATSIDTSTGLEVASNVVSHDTLSLDAYGVAFVNDNLVVMAYLAAEPIIITLDADTLAVIKGWTLDISTDDPTGADQYTFDSASNTVVFVNTASGDLNALKAVIGPTGLITASAYSMPADDGISWDIIQKVVNYGGSATMIAGRVINGPSTFGSFAVFDNDDFDGTAAVMTLDVKSAVKGLLPPKGAGNTIYAVGNIDDKDAFIIKTDLTGNLLASGIMKRNIFNDLAYVTLSNMEMVAIAGQVDGKPSMTFVDPNLAQLINFRQDLSGEINALTTNEERTWLFASLYGSYGDMAIMNGGGNYPNPAPEFSLTTLLLATLLAGGLVLFVVRRRYK